MRARNLFSVLAIGLMLGAAPGVAVASREVPGTFLRLSLSPDDPFFVTGDVVTLFIDATPSSSVSGNVGLGVILPVDQSASVCPSSGDRLMVFFNLGTGGGLQCLSTWNTNPASRITQFPGLSAAAGSHAHVVVARQTVQPPLPRGEFIIFAYVLNGTNPAVIIDFATTTFDVE